MGYEGRSNNDNILRAMEGASAKGVEVHKKKEEHKEIKENHNKEALWKELYTSEFNRLRREYPVKNDLGEDVDDEWYKETASVYADSILKLKERMQG
ncbi:MAG: hypothetical protein UV60_C0001G0029 [Parcubacteria group bacterium GW2011_GWA2_43_11]|nr:MAG: hypothetical protein UU89_C0006G0030 [Parcubacteria group bacterium GW2011_GWC2_42_11]KKS86430.1 MAG: hypothetical protein UV60_C0001G0029 [Parcubacteria group bacterium GW2011_GWA2_43_11]